VLPLTPSCINIEAHSRAILSTVYLLSDCQHCSIPLFNPSARSALGPLCNSSSSTRRSLWNFLKQFCSSTTWTARGLLTHSNHYFSSRALDGLPPAPPFLWNSVILEFSSATKSSWWFSSLLQHSLHVSVIPLAHMNPLRSSHQFPYCIPFSNEDVVTCKR
jgi:hypothetical protein